MGRSEVEKRTEWDFELRCKPYRLADLLYAICGCIILEALEMEDESGWKRFEKHLLGRITRARLADLHGLALQKMCERVLNGAY